MPFVKKDRYFIDSLKKNPFEFASLLYPIKLNKDSVVFDVGGYVGDWSLKIYKKFSPNIYIFEPVSKFVEIIEKKFKGKDKIHIFNFGISGHDKKVNLCIEDESSSAHKDAGEKGQLVTFIDIVSVIDKNTIEKIDLLKINIEGEEYELLERLIESGYINHCEHILVQFHNFVHDADQKRSECIKGINKTHTTTFSYPYVWEFFTKNK
jgi:FkbM family methyltransferase